MTNNNYNYKYIFGPVPSRRLGFSLGIDVYIDKNGSVGVAKSGTRDQERLGGYEVSRERLEDWITFLRSCGGFEVC